MTFFVDQKVVCINSDIKVSSVYASKFGWHSLPVKDQVYTIRSLGVHQKDPYTFACTLEELRNDQCSCISCPHGEVSFVTTRFRPLIEKKRSTDISFALDILDKANRTITEKVSCLSGYHTQTLDLLDVEGANDNRKRAARGFGKRVRR